MFVCSLVVVRELVDYERFRDYKAGIPCFVIETCLVSMSSTDRHGSSFLYNLIVAKCWFQ